MSDTFFRDAVRSSLRIAKPLVTVLLAAWMSGPPSARAQKVDVRAQDSVDFASYQSFSFRPFTVLATGEPWRGAAMEQLLRSQIASELDADGIAQVDGPPDLFVEVRLGFEQKIQSGRSTAVDRGETWVAPSPRFSRDGFALIELVDAATGNGVWRAYCSANGLNDRNREKKASNAIKRAFAQFPPR